MFLMTQQEYIDKIQNAQNAEDAQNALSHVFSTLCDSADNYYRKVQVEGLTWDSFYAAREVEDKFQLGSFTSAYIAVHLAYPKIGKLYASVATNSLSDKDDLLSRIYAHLMEELIPKWDKEKNDNFWAYMERNLSTSVNAMRNEDRGISDYMVKTHGLSVASLDQLRDNPDSNFDVADERQNVEDNVISRMERSRNAVFNRVVGLKADVRVAIMENKETLNDALDADIDEAVDTEKAKPTRGKKAKASKVQVPNNNPTEDNIWHAIVCKKLFNSDKEDEIEMVNDPAMNKMIMMYLDWNDKALANGVSKDEKADEVSWKDSIVVA